MDRRNALALAVLLLAACGEAGTGESAPAGSAGNVDAPSESGPIEAPAAASGQAEVRQAWARLPVLADRPGAAYFTLVGGKEADRLIAISSPRVERIELHEGGSHGGMATMRPIDSVAVGVGEQVAFAPGGRHAMLFGIDPALQAGQRLPLTFRFASGLEVGAEAELRAAGGE